MAVERLAEGRAFHNAVQAAFLTDLMGATGFRERGWRLTAGGRGRVDLAVVTDDREKMLIIIEIKGTDWDKIRADRVKRNVQRHIRQLLAYLDTAIGELEGGQWESVAGALLYPSRPASVVSLAHIEAAAAKQAIMLTWYDEVPWRRKPTQHEGAKASRPCHQQHELAVGCTGFGESAQNGIVAQQWRRWLPGPKHGLARGVMIYGAPRPPGPEQLRDSLGQCESLRAWARLQGLELDPVPEDLTLLDEAIDRAIAEYGPHAPMSPEGNDAGLFLGTVIVSAIHGAHWRLWPNGHPVVRLASGRDLDVVALGHDRVHTGQPRLADVYTDAAATDPGSQT